MELTKTNAVLRLSKGYKHTEVGVIPEDWSVIKLAQAVDFLDGMRRPIKSNERIAGDIPYYGASGIIDWVRDYIFDDELILLGEDGENILSRNLPLAFIVRGKSWINNHAHVMKPKEDFDIYFLTEFLESLDYSLLNSGTAQPKLNKQSCLNINVVKPTLTEQKAIATALSDVDALISSLEKLIVKKKAIKQGAMQELLTPPHKGGKRLPGFSGEWERVKVDKVINVARGGSPRPIQNFITTSPDGINWIKIGDTSVSSKYIVSSVEKIIPDGANFSRRVNCGDFLLSNSMSFGRPYILKIDGCIHDGWLVLQNYQTYFNTEFLYYTLMSKDVFNQYIMKASGSSVLNLNKEIVKTVELNRPTDMNEQKAIAQILSDMDKEIESLELKKEKYHQIKQGMMQELLTGKTRLA
jgi:type I restriction enzyme S subunit